METIVSKGFKKEESLALKSNVKNIGKDEERSFAKTHTFERWMNSFVTAREDSKLLG